MLLCLFVMLIHIHLSTKYIIIFNYVVNCVFKNASMFLLHIHNYIHSSYSFIHIICLSCVEEC